MLKRHLFFDRAHYSADESDKGFSCGMQVFEIRSSNRFGTMAFFNKSSAALLFMFVVLAYGAMLVAQQEKADVPFLYPDPRTVGVIPYVMDGHPPVPVTPNRYAGISEQEREQRILWDQCAEQEGFPKYEQPPCPLCLDDPTTPCKTCKMCLAGFPCEKTLCRHCVQPRSKNMGNSCDLTAGDEPCGTCDACREHRSDPCEHANNGYGPLGEFNPYKEVPFLAVIPRPIVDTFNNGARKFPVYYNPAPYYRPHWNPSTFAAYARPFTFRYSCSLCFQDPCGCNQPGMAGQVPYAYTCKFCNRNPCACTAEICNVTKPLDPAGVTAALAKLKEETTELRPVPIRDILTSTTETVPLETVLGGGGVRTDSLIDDNVPVIEPNRPMQRPSLEMPAP